MLSIGQQTSAKRVLYKERADYRKKQIGLTIQNAKNKNVSTHRLRVMTGNDQHKASLDSVMGVLNGDKAYTIDNLLMVLFASGLDLAVTKENKRIPLLHPPKEPKQPQQP